MNTALPDVLIAELPSIDLDDAIAACEVLVQEKVGTWAVPVGGSPGPVEFRRMFAARAVVGVHGVRSMGDAVWAIEQEADFALADVLVEPEVVARFAEEGIALVVPAFTPTEILVAAQRGADAVAVMPAHVLDTSYAKTIRRLVEGVVVVARGDLTSFAAQTWLSHGIDGVIVADALLGDCFASGNLAELRHRARLYAQIRG